MSPGDEPVRYVVPDDVLTAELEGEAVLLHMDTKRYYRLNETGACIWKGLEEGLGRAGLVERLCERFAVEADDAAREADAFLERLVEQGLLSSGGETRQDEE